MKKIKNILLNNNFIKISSILLIIIVVIVIFTNNNVIYKNKTYGFQVEYPQTWKHYENITNIKDSLLFVRFVEKDKKYSANLLVPVEIQILQNDKKLNMDQFLEKREKEFKQNDIAVKNCAYGEVCVDMRENVDSESRIIFAGIDSFKEVTSPKYLSFYYVKECVYTINNNFIYKICHDVTPNSSNNQKDVNNIVASFKFLD